MLTQSEITDLSRLSQWKSMGALAADWLIIGFAFAAAALYPHPLVYLMAALLITRTQIALAMLMHDGVHWLLLKNRTLNDIVGQLFTSAPLFLSLFSYRANHLKHHQKPLAADDPDMTLIGGYPISPRSFARKIGRDLFAVSYFKFLKYFLYGAHARKKRLLSDADAQGKARAPRAMKSTMPVWQVALSGIAVNATLFGILWASGHPWLYLGLWLLPTMTIVQVFLRIRGIAEHAGLSSDRDQRLASRTVVNPWQAFFVAPHKVGYHIEHHMYLGVPFYNLDTVHTLMQDRGELPAQNVHRSYVSVLRELVLFR